MFLFLAWIAAALPAEVTTAMSTGDCRAVEATLPSPTTPAERLVVGHCAIQHDEPVRAAQVLTDLPPGVHRDYGSMILASASIDLGRGEAALRALDGLELPGSAGRQVALLRGRALILLGRSLEARPGLRALLQSDERDEALYWLAAGAEDRGEVDAAIDAYRSLWATSVRGDGSARAADRLHALGAPIDRLDQPAVRELAAQRVAALEGAYRFGDALRLRRRIVAADPDHPLGRAADLARASARGRDYPAALELYRQLYGAPEAARGSPRQLFDYALHTSRTGDYDTAALLYQRLIDAHPTSDKAVEASFKLGYLEVDRAAWDAAIPKLREHLRVHPASPHADEARWWIGWAQHQRGKTSAAHAAWRALIDAHPRSGLVPAARYWLARSATDPAEQRAGLERVRAAHPFTGYAFYAQSILDGDEPSEAAPREPTALERPAWPEALAAHPAVTRFEALLQAGMFDAARAELQPLVAATPRGDRTTDLALAWALIEAGAIREGQARARAYCGRPGPDVDPAVAGACWPRPAWPMVQTLSAQHGLPPLLAYGVMVTESALDPTAVSLAGARGLMQLMPVEAERLHRGLYGERAWHPDLLFRPAYNVSLGITELGQRRASLHDLVDGPALIPVIASYNGGEDAVRRWAGELGGTPRFDDFAEQISYTETRRYVRSVLGTYMLYRHVYGER